MKWLNEHDLWDMDEIPNSLKGLTEESLFRLDSRYLELDLTGQVPTCLLSTNLYHIVGRLCNETSN